MLHGKASIEIDGCFKADSRKKFAVCLFKLI